MSLVAILAVIITINTAIGHVSHHCTSISRCIAWMQPDICLMCDMAAQHTPAEEPDVDHQPPPPPADDGMDYGGDMQYDDPPASTAPQTGAGES